MGITVKDLEPKASMDFCLEMPSKKKGVTVNIHSGNEHFNPEIETNRKLLGRARSNNNHQVGSIQFIGRVIFFIAPKFV